MRLDASTSSAVDSAELTHIGDLPEAMDFLDDFDLPSLDELLQQFPASSDQDISDADIYSLKSCCDHASPGSQASAGHPVGQAGLSCNHPSGERTACKAAISRGPIPFEVLDDGCSLEHRGQLPASAPATHGWRQPTSSNDSNPSPESPDSSSDRDEGETERCMADSGAGHRAENDGHSPGPSNQQEGSRAGSPIGNDGEEEQKRQARMQRNRESAMQSRQRRKMQLEELERRNAELQMQNTHLTGLVAGLSAENAALRHQLAAVQGNTNMPNGMPAQPAAVQPPPRMPIPFMPWMPGMPYMGPTPKVPIQRLPVKRPEPAKAAASGDKKANTKKRARVAAGSTALLALFCFFVFMGPQPYWPGSDSISASRSLTLSQNIYAALPAAQRGGGRVLQSLSDDLATAGNWTAHGAPAGLLDKNTANGMDSFLEDGDNASDVHRANAALVLRTNDQTKASALQRLKDLGPVTLYSDWGMEGGVAKVWENTGSVGIRSGRPLMPPMQCREVFSLDASQNMDAAAARRQLQNYLATMSSFRGRALAGGPLAMPPVSRHMPDQPEEERTQSKFSTKIGCDIPDDDVVVSIMLPAQQPEKGAGNKSLTTLDEIFVVVVKPMKKYVTYACSLQDSILV